MTNITWREILFQITCIAFLCFLIYILFREYKSLKYQKRFENFALTSSKDPEKSYLDQLLASIWTKIGKISKILERNALLSEYGASYKKYLVLKDTRAISGMDYFVLKLISAIFFLFLSVIMIPDTVFLLSIFISMCFLLFGFFLPDYILKRKLNRQKIEYQENLNQAIILINNSLSAGKNIWVSLKETQKKLEGPLKKELEKINADISYGLSIEVAFKRFYERVGLPDIQYLASALTVLNQTGGNMAKIFSIIEKNIQSRKQFQNEIDYLLSASKRTSKILICIPPILVVIITLLNKEYFLPFFQTPYGFLTFIFLFLLYIAYCYIMIKLGRRNAE